MLLLLLSCGIFVSAFASIQYNEVMNLKCPVQDADSDVIIAGVFPVHVEVTAENCQRRNLCGYREAKEAGVTRCIRINKAGISWVEAMIETVKKINNNKNILPGVKLGYVICDGYNNIDRAFDISLMLQSLRHSNTKTANTSQNNCSCYHNDTRTILGVIGGASSKISTSINYIVNLFSIPQISYSSTSPSLSDRSSFRTFFRTIPSDTYQGKALADIVKYFKWSYISTVATSDDYGRLGIEAFKKASESLDICFALEALFDITLSLDSTKSQIRKIVSDLKSEEKANVIVLFCEWPSAQAILQEAERQNLTGRTWIASEAWGENNFVSSIREDVIGGMLGLIPVEGEIEAFKKHVREIEPLGYTANTWFKEYMIGTLKCNNLTEGSNVTVRLDYSFSKVANVMDAVTAIAYALHEVLGCTSKDGHPKDKCSWLEKKTPIDVANVLSSMNKVNFTGESGLPVNFDENGDLLGSYLITNLQPPSKHEPRMKFARIGRWDGIRRKLYLTNRSAVFWNGWGMQTIESACSSQCMPGYFGIQGRSKCCWECFRCQDGHVKSKYGQQKCEKCADGYVANANRSACIKLIEQYLAWNNGEAVVICVISFAAALLVLVSLSVFIRLRDTPIVKASSRELSYGLLATLFLLFLTPVVWIGSPTKTTCILRPITTALLMTIATSILSVRAYRYVCIFEVKFHKKSTKLQSIPSQFVSIFISTLFPLAAITIWFTFFPPDTSKRIIFDRKSPQLYKECNIETQYLTVALGMYLLFLSIVCCAMAFQTRKLPEVFNDAKWLAMTIFTQNIVWFASSIVYIARPNDRAMIMSINVVLCGLVIWAFNFLPKFIIIIKHPERNKKEFVSRQIFMMTKLRFDQQHPGSSRRRAIEGYMKRNSGFESSSPVTRASDRALANGIEPQNVTLEISSEEMHTEKETW